MLSNIIALYTPGTYIQDFELGGEVRGSGDGRPQWVPGEKPRWGQNSAVRYVFP